MAMELLVEFFSPVPTDHPAAKIGVGIPNIEKEFVFERFGPFARKFNKDRIAVCRVWRFDLGKFRKPSGQVARETRAVGGDLAPQIALKIGVKLSGQKTCFA